LENVSLDLSLGHIAHVGVSPRISLKLFGRVNLCEKHNSTLRRDGRTDDILYSITALCL